MVSIFGGGGGAALNDIMYSDFVFTTNHHLILHAFAVGKRFQIFQLLLSLNSAGNPGQRL